MNQSQTHLGQRTLPKEGRHTNHPFPKDMVSILRCNEDAGEFAIVKEDRVLGDGIIDARLRCNICGSEFPIEDGIVRLLPHQLSPEDQHEMIIRDSIDYDCTNPGFFISPAEGWRSVLSDKLEVPAHLKELRVSQSNTVLELACGDGRFTSLIAESGPRVLAVDFSINALRLLAHRLPAGARVGRVHADINHLHCASRSFDRAISLTPLDSRDERMAMYRMVAHSLTDDGRYVASVEHDDLNRRLLGLPQVRRYSRDGILIEHLTKKALRREVAPYFAKLRIRPIRPRVLLVTKLPRLFALAVLRTVAALPLVRQFGELLLLTAQRPVRLPVEGEYRQGNWMAKSVYRIYMRMKNQKASWGEESVGSIND
jgi:ubiquinone/menaquinone biosynthesis C-methylase UbiE/uncharacterized protein YbaR (Trm112 family)